MSVVAGIFGYVIYIMTLYIRKKFQEDVRKDPSAGSG
jgi:hypothetical protein